MSDRSRKTDLPAGPAATLAEGDPGTRVKPRVHRQVVKTIAQRILGGEIAPGSQLPSESLLQDEYNVSRSALREAIKVIASKGLVVSRPRVGTTVRPREEWHLLDPDVLFWSMELRPSPEFVLSLIEARQVIEPAAARFAASRAGATDIAPIEEAFREMRRARDAGDFTAFNTADIAYHKALLRASRNAVFQQLSTTIGAALAYSFRISVERARDPGASVANHGEVIERIRGRDPAGAQAAMTRLLDIAVIDLGLSGKDGLES